MKEVKEKTNKIKINKEQLAVRIVCGFLAALMIISVCGTALYYLISSLGK